MRVFWERSYEAATLSDLTPAMGINRSSMSLIRQRYFGERGIVTAKDPRVIREALEKPVLRDVVVDLLHAAPATAPERIRSA
jgi:hypothetical protein